MAPRSIPIYIRWLSKVDFNGGLFGCWLWTGAQRGGMRDWDRGGKYGVISRGKRSEGNISTHILVAEWIWGGPLPAGYHVDHLCRNRLCCNPLHLDPVPKGVNIGRSNRVQAIPKDDEWAGGDPFADLDDIDQQPWETRTDLGPFDTDSGLYEDSIYDPA